MVTKRLKSVPSTDPEKPRVPTARRQAVSVPPRPTRKPPSGASASGPLLGGGKPDLASLALRLRDEQLRAKVVYFGADQATNAELDAITAAVVAEIEALQAATPEVATPPMAVADVERELARTLHEFMDTLLSSRRTMFLRRKIEEVQRRVMTLYFNSEPGGGSKATEGSLDLTEAEWPDQALYFAIQQHVPSIVADLYMLKYKDTRVRDAAVERLQGFTRSLRVEFLSRTTPELEKVLRIFRDALGSFLKQFRKDLASFCERVVHESGVAAQSVTGYKIAKQAFGAFRTAFERRFVDGLVASMSDDVVANVPAHRDTLRDPTVRFLMDPRVYTEVCAVVCDGVYDFLHDEGYLDLPADWRARAERT